MHKIIMSFFFFFFFFLLLLVFLLSSTIMSTSARVGKKNKSKNAPGNRSDPGWEHGIEVDNAKRKVKCRHC
jgi:hypothetical protein